MSTSRRTNLLKTYSRRRNSAAAPRLASARPSSTLVGPSTPSRGTTPPKTRLSHTAAKVAKKPETPRNSKTARTARPEERVASTSAKRSAALESTDYDQDDEITGLKFRRSTRRVLFITHRPADASQRLVPERIIQTKTPSKLYAYWSSFGRPREATLGTGFFHIFDIVGQDAARGLRVQWEGYGTSDAETTWEPVEKVRSSNPALLRRHLGRQGIGEISLHRDVRTQNHQE
ncbi:hypothetical protein ColTof4_01444 [Colletotrichum tofieldiae]|nr:hypothetical protein ColTof3_08701 [Colletotrichum tofieldiae]GKT69021.1 hypothetical protein ColTof4_01444 [Colletotrichum tofieldiae]GKT96889.1 hypothetical protein Ct61P_14739 [Colletotrichum tofieldiae]